MTKKVICYQKVCSYFKKGGSRDQNYFSYWCQQCISQLDCRFPSEKGEPIDLRTIPSIIGGSIEDRHGIVLAKSTSAKKHGVVTGEPIIQAMQKCPNLIAYPPDFALYSKCSRAMFDILSEYSDRIEPFSIDEGFLDYTGMEALFGPPIEAAKAIQKRILCRAWLYRQYRYLDK